MGTLNPLVYSESFFHPDHSLCPISSKPDVDESSQEKQPRLLRRSLSASSFFYKGNRSTSSAQWKEIDNKESMLNFT
ncbi:hypothetical protein EP47_06735 [Legionella norrlandica]|uniref:Uncharacterized protein n=1 Tax=Legionella norrlandica TaxID=1498499 RepID=A0A0A2SPU5_9GAMM|nr:hypothetical protein EP47_06735 [Legionella norrlandica]